MKIRIEPMNTPDIWRLSGNTVKLRIYADRPFITSDGQFILQGTPGQTNSLYLEVDCQLTGGNVLLIPEIEIDSTVDGLDHPSGTYTAELVAGGRRVTFLANFPVNTVAGDDPSTTWPEIILLRNLFEPRTLDDSLTRQIYGLISSAVGQLNRANATNRGVTRLTVDPENPMEPIAVGANDPEYLAAIHGAGASFVSGDYASLSAAVAAIGAVQGSLLVETQDWPTDGSVTVPATLVLEWGDFGSLLLTTGNIVTVNSDVSNWPARKLFGNAVAGQGTIRFTANTTIRDVFPQWWGAVADRNGTAGTNNRLTVQAAVTALETAPGLGTLRCTGQFVIGNTDGAALQLLLVSKGITLAGTGSMFDGVYASIDTPVTVPIVRYRPINHPDNEGLTIAKFTISSAGVSPNLAFPGAWDATNPSASHALVLDATGVVGGGTMAIRYLHIYDSNFIPNFAGGADAGVFGIVAVGAIEEGTPTQSQIGPNNQIFNGISFPACGDQVGITDNNIHLYNGLDIRLVSGAGCPIVHHNIIHSRKGIFIQLNGDASCPAITFNFIELDHVDAVGTPGGAMIEISSTSVTAGGGYIVGNSVNNLAPAPALHGVLLDTKTSPIIEGNNFRVQAGRQAIVNLTTAEVVIGRNTYIPPTAPFGAANQTAMLPTVYGYLQMPPSGQGLGINLSLVGSGRFIGAVGTDPSIATDLRDTARTQGYTLNEVGVLTAFLLQYGSTHPTAALRNALQLANITATGKITLWTNGVERMYVSAAGRVGIAGLAVFANNAAALGGGLVAGELYRTGADPDSICVVH